jgi:hypothetical protein
MVPPGAPRPCAPGAPRLSGGAAAQVFAEFLEALVLLAPAKTGGKSPTPEATAHFVDKIFIPELSRVMPGKLERLAPRA